VTHTPPDIPALLLELREHLAWCEQRTVGRSWIVTARLLRAAIVVIEDKPVKLKKPDKRSK
jgi:hypothetical protein